MFVIVFKGDRERKDRIFREKLVLLMEIWFKYKFKRNFF